MRLALNSDVPSDRGLSIVWDPLIFVRGAEQEVPHLGLEQGPRIEIVGGHCLGQDRMALLVNLARRSCSRERVALRGDGVGLRWGSLPTTA